MVMLCTVFLLLVVSQCSAQAPGDEDDRCLRSPYVHTYEDNVKVLMDSYNYLQLLPGNGTGYHPIASALWNDKSFDGNDIISTTAATYWQQSAGTCQFQIKVCGFRQPGVAQDNWLFTQHISKSFDANTNNYPVEILVNITYALQSCRSNRNPPCNTRFTLYRYITTSQQLPSTNGDGFMNKNNYVSFGTVSPARTGARYTETHRFTLQPQQTGFYIAIEDTGTCVIVSRLLVYRHCSYCSAQAPGDEDDRCLRPPYVHTYEDNVKVLMDSYNYLQLLPGSGTGNPPIASALWNDMSFDGNDIISTTSATYWQQSAGTCQFQIKVCGFRQPGVAQDNWLFTQHISKSFDANYTVEILVNITYALQNCRSDRNPSCNTRFKLYRYITNETQLPSTGGSGFINKDNYMSFGTATPAATGDRYTETHRFTLQPQQTSFYITIEDTGTCVIISRLLVYRHNCKYMQTELVLYPETAAPISGSSNIDITCVPNADTFGSPQVTCDSDGMWGSQSPRCECRGGYEDRGTECRACLPGYYRSLTANRCADRSCCPCPVNTKTDQVAAAQCECLDGYFRNTESRESTDGAQAFVSAANEQPSTRCTQPPSAPIGLMVTAVSSMSVFVNWLTPAQTGSRRDLYYQVEHSDPDNLGAFINTEYDDSTSHTFNNLRPATQYCVRVSAHNGVSDQDPDDPDGAQLRTAEECTTTPEDIPGAPVDLRVFYPAVVWQPPVNPNGVIINYDLTFRRGGQSRTVTTPGDQTYYVISTQDIPGSSGQFTVEVRARNGAGRGNQISTSAAPDGSITSPPLTTPVEPPTPATCPTTDCSTCTCSTPTPPTIRPPGTVHIDDITVLGCGAISWKPPQDTGGELPGYIVRFFDGATYETSRSEDREIQRSFVDDPGRQWAISENLPSGRTVYADIRAKNSAGTGPFSERIVVADNTICPQDPTLTIPERITISSDSSYPFVVWSPPTNTEVASYDLIFTRAGASRTGTSTVPYYVISDSDIPGTSGSFTVEVRGRNSAGSGQYSPRITMEPVTRPPCSTSLPPVTCPICPTRPGTVRNVRALNCTILWEPLEYEIGVIVEYRVRLYTGNSYSDALSSQRTVLRTLNTRVTPADNMPTERPVYAIVKAKNIAGFSVWWSAPVLVATTTGCP